VTESEVIAVAENCAQWRGCKFGGETVTLQVSEEFPRCGHEEFRKEFMGCWPVCFDTPQPCLGNKWFFMVNPAGKVVRTNAPPFWTRLLWPF
jgi:hypothetical protein